MKRRELLTSKKALWIRHFWYPNCQTSVEFDTLDSSFVRANRPPHRIASEPRLIGGGGVAH